MNYVWAFVVGGAICVIGQLFIDYTKLTPARILTGYVVAGVVLSAVGVYKPLAEFAGAGASVPLLGFGHLLAQGVVQAVDRCGLPGAFTGGLTAAAGGDCCQFDFCRGGGAGGKEQGPELNFAVIGALPGRQGAFLNKIRFLCSFVVYWKKCIYRKRGTHSHAKAAYPGACYAHDAAVCGAHDFRRPAAAML